MEDGGEMGGWDRIKGEREGQMGEKGEQWREGRGVGRKGGGEERSRREGRRRGSDGKGGEDGSTGREEGEMGGREG